MDAAEVYAPMQEWLWLTVLFVGILLFGMAAAGGFVWRRQHFNLYRKNYEAEHKYRGLFESSRDAMMTVEPPSWKVTAGNPAMLEMFRLRSARQLTALGPWDLSPERQPDGRDSGERAKEMIETAMREGSHFFEWTHKRMDGEEFPATVLLTRTEQAGKTIVQATVRDITAQKKAEEALRKSETKYELERKYRAILDQTFEFVGLMTPDGTLVEANRAALKFAGIEESDVLGKPFWETPWWTHSREMQDRLRDAIKAASLGEFVRFEATHPAPDGGIHCIDFSLKPVRNEGGEVIFLIPEGRDVTDRKQAEEGMREFRKQVPRHHRQLPRGYRVH